MSYYINEPTVQEPTSLIKFMGLGFVKSLNALNKLTNAPRHWRGQRIEVKDRSRRAEEVSVTVFIDGYLDYCSHANQEIEPIGFNGGTDGEYTMNLAVCQKCNAGWDEDGEQRLEPWDAEEIIIKQKRSK